MKPLLFILLVVFLTASPSLYAKEVLFGFALGDQFNATGQAAPNMKSGEPTYKVRPNVSISPFSELRVAVRNSKIFRITGIAKVKTMADCQSLFQRVVVELNRKYGSVRLSGAFAMVERYPVQYNLGCEKSSSILGSEYQLVFNAVDTEQRDRVVF